MDSHYAGRGKKNLKSLSHYMDNIVQYDNLNGVNAFILQKIKIKYDKYNRMTKNEN